jgi:hypothetical protein
MYRHLGFCSGGQNQGNSNTAWTSENLWPRNKVGSVDRKLLRGNIRYRGRFWLSRPNRILTEDRPSDQTSCKGG